MTNETLGCVPPKESRLCDKGLECVDKSFAALTFAKNISSKLFGDTKDDVVRDCPKVDNIEIELLVTANILSEVLNFLKQIDDKL